MAKSNDPAGIRREQRLYKAAGFAPATDNRWRPVKPPTDAQIAVAQSLAGRSGDVIPSACLVDRSAMQAWLSERLPAKPYKSGKR